MMMFFFPRGCLAPQNKRTHHASKICGMDRSAVVRATVITSLFLPVLRRGRRRKHEIRVVVLHRHGAPEVGAPS